MNEAAIGKGTIMKRRITLALLGLACLMAMPSTAEARYADGMNLYEYVQSAPTGSVDPMGLITLVTSNADIVAAYAELEASVEGYDLIELIQCYEGATKLQVAIGIVSHHTTDSHMSPSVRQPNDLYWTVEGGVPTPYPFGAPSMVIGMNPLDAVWPDQMVMATGDGPYDVEQGMPLDELLFHELQHALDVLTWPEGAPYKGLTSPADPDSKFAADIDCCERWGDLANYDAVMQANKYRAEKGRPLRQRYDLTKEQRNTVKAMEKEFRSGAKSGKPLREYPVFPFDERYWIEGHRNWEDLYWWKPLIHVMGR